MVGYWPGGSRFRLRTRASGRGFHRARHHAAWPGAATAGRDRRASADGCASVPRGPT